MKNVSSILLRLLQLVACLGASLTSLAHGFHLAPPLSQRRSVVTFSSSKRSSAAGTTILLLQHQPIIVGTPPPVTRTRLQAVSVAAEESDVEPASSSSTIASATFNLIKACVGSGVLALPSGLALMSDVPQIAIPACILLVAIGCLSAYTFYILGKLCHESDSNPSSLGELWQEIVGPNSSWVVDLTTVIMCYGVCLTYSMVLGDFTSALLLQRWSRNVCILTLTGTCLYPLARLPSLEALAPISLAGVGGVVVTCGAMLWQWKNRLGLTNLPLPPIFNVQGTSPNPLSALVLMSMAATSYLCHFSAPAFLQSVGQNLKDYRRITALGFISVGVINMVILAAGFLTFGGNCAGVILNSYAQTDILASVSRFLMLLSVLGSYPFTLGGAKTSLYNLWNFFVASKRKKEIVVADNDDDSDDAATAVNDEPFTVSPRANHIVTVIMLAAITLPSLILKNAGLVVSFNGATMGSAITYIFPSMLVLAKLKNDGSTGFSKTKFMNRLVLAFGWTAAIAGGACSILSAYAPQVLR